MYTQELALHGMTRRRANKAGLERPEHLECRCLVTSQAALAAPAALVITVATFRHFYM